MLIARHRNACVLQSIIYRTQQSINQSINQSLLFQAAWPIETQDKTRQTGIDRQQ